MCHIWTCHSHLPIRSEEELLLSDPLGGAASVRSARRSCFCPIRSEELLAAVSSVHHAIGADARGRKAAN